MGYFIEVEHTGLGKHRIITGRDAMIVEMKARVQLGEWERQYQTQCAKVAHQAKQKFDRTQRLADLAQKQEEADERTAEAQKALAEVTGLLDATLRVDDAVNWESLKNRAPFPEREPPPPIYEQYPPAPAPDAPIYQPKLGVFDKLVKSREESKWAEARGWFERDYSAWQYKVETIKTQNEGLEIEYQNRYAVWQTDKTAYEEKQSVENQAVDQRKAAYLAGDEEAIADYCETVLINSRYPESFPKDFELAYNPETKLLVVDYSLPSPDDMPKLKEVKYVKSKDALKPTDISEGEQNRNYDSALYQICLRTIHEMFEADRIGALAAVVFNGWVDSVDKSTGKQARGCVISVQAKKDEFSEFDLSKVDPKACFKALKGIGSSQLHSLTPVAPVIQMSREDKRFVSSYEVAGQLDEGFNLAAMPWEDFEHLIRELFEKEFKQNGGEVKITQASRDGGVDAVAFDPDPIRGGKIVIQSKRYTNTVGVAFVRDLYGTVMNEGATKGILVTTSDYGPDAYEFAMGKPLTLLNGGNLLHLLEKHGHKAKIDMKAAKAFLSEGK